MDASPPGREAMFVERVSPGDEAEDEPVLRASDLRMRPGVERVYESEGFAVTWAPEMCTHSANCVRGNARVFRPRERPWVRLGSETAEAIAAVVATCPSGALGFTRTPRPGTPAAAG